MSPRSTAVTYQNSCFLYVLLRLDEFLCQFFSCFKVSLIIFSVQESIAINGNDRYTKFLPGIPADSFHVITNNAGNVIRLTGSDRESCGYARRARSDRG